MSASKKSRQRKRRAMGYDDSKPEQCSNCQHFVSALHATRTNDYMPPRCGKFLIGVVNHAICDSWEPHNE